MSLLEFRKEERLCSRTAINELFKSGKSFVVYPYKVVFQKIPTKSTPTKILITIPKRNFKKAAHRNRLKRQTKEAYRLNKQLLYRFLESKSFNLTIGLIYIGSKEQRYDVLCPKIILILNRLIELHE
tara:strand:+ start:110 stop:490 length:381 start_codon:yes stop_codon:yes gene_type:complete